MIGGAILTERTLAQALSLSQIFVLAGEAAAGPIKVQSGGEYCMRVGCVAQSGARARLPTRQRLRAARRRAGERRTVQRRTGAAPHRDGRATQAGGQRAACNARSGQPAGRGRAAGRGRTQRAGGQRAVLCWSFVVNGWLSEPTRRRAGLRAAGIRARLARPSLLPPVGPHHRTRPLQTRRSLPLDTLTLHHRSIEPSCAPISLRCRTALVAGRRPRIPPCSGLALLRLHPRRIIPGLCTRQGLPRSQPGTLQRCTPRRPLSSTPHLHRTRRPHCDCCSHPPAQWSTRTAPSGRPLPPPSTPTSSPTR